MIPHRQTASAHPATNPAESVVDTVVAAVVAAFGRPRVLIADDDPKTAETLASIADGSAYRIVCTRDGREAYRVLIDDADFAAAIFNMTMPHLRGVDLVRHMKTEKRLMRIPVIIISGDNGLHTVADSFAAGAIAFLAKPFAAEQLQRTLLLALSSKDCRNKTARTA
jgi:DNA-binding NtrC family response regulator